jgi:hypothetical protein
MKLMYLPVRTDQPGAIGEWELFVDMMAKATIRRVKL